MKTEFVTGTVQQYDPKALLYTIQTEDGRVIRRVRRIGDILDNEGRRQIAEIDTGTEILAVLSRGYIQEMVQGFILGAYHTIGEDGTPGTTGDKDVFIQGSQGFAGRKGQRLVMYPDGRFEIRSGAWVAQYLDAEENAIHQVFQKFYQNKDKNNFQRWHFHPEDDDLQEHLYHLGITGSGSLAKTMPDIEVLAGALHDLSDTDLLQGAADTGAILSIRATVQDTTPPAEVFFQLGDLTDGALTSLRVTRGDEMTYQQAIGTLPEDVVMDVQVNDARCRVYADGSLLWENPEAEVRIGSDGVIHFGTDVVKIGSADAENHLPVAEIVIEKMEKLIQAVTGAQWTCSQPGTPTQGPPVNLPEFKRLQAELDEIKSQHHLINE